MKTKILFFNLLRSVLCGDKLAQVALSSEKLEELYALSQKHDLAHLVAHAIEGLEFTDCAVLEKFRSAKMRAIYRYARIEHEFEQLRTVLEKAHIAFLPLKGSVIRQYYPEPWMRTSCDIDILVKEKDLVSASDILSNCGWTLEKKWPLDHDLSFYSASGVHLELHFSLAENMDNIDPVLEQVWDHCALMEGKHYEYRQSIDFFLFHHLAHMAHHFLAGGCGIRPFMDLWILKKTGYTETEGFQHLCEQARLKVFYSSVMELMETWFERKEYTPHTQQMEHYILFGGTFGTLSNRVLIDQVKTGSKAANLRERIWQPYDQLSMYYPILKKHPWMFPFFQIVRWVRILWLGRLGHSISELQAGSKISKEHLESAKQLLQEIGLYGIKRSSLQDE